QVKNGPVDFQPREPFHPLFGAVPHTNVALEVQVTKEYLGFNTHLAYLGTMWEEVLRSRTWRPRPSATVADSISAMAGVANTGTVGVRSATARMESRLLPPGRRGGHRLRPDRQRQQRRRAVCARGRAPLLGPAHGRRRLPLVVPPCPLGPPSRYRPHPVGRARP